METCILSSFQTKNVIIERVTELIVGDQNEHRTTILTFYTKFVVEKPPKRSFFMTYWFS